MAMNESEIVAQNTPKTEPSEPTKVEGGIETTFREFAPLYEYFDIEKSDKADKALESIWEYCKGKSEFKDKDSVILYITKLKHELGSPGMGEAPYSKIKMYIDTYRQMEERSKLLEEMKGR